MLVTTPKPTLVFSWDYDSCTDILFHNIFEYLMTCGRYDTFNALIYRSKLMQTIANDLSDAETPAVVKALQNIIDDLQEKIKEHVNTNDVNRTEVENILKQQDELFEAFCRQFPNTELYVGSLRQSHTNDEYNHTHTFQSGLCLTNFPAFCKRVGWTFQPLLLCDIDNRKPAGTGIQPGSKLNFRELIYPNDDCKNTNAIKEKILRYQFQDIKRRRPNENIIFKFYDDKESIHQHLNSQLKSRSLVPPQRFTVDLTQFDSYDGATKIIAHITPPNYAAFFGIPENCVGSIHEEHFQAIESYAKEFGDEAANNAYDEAVLAQKPFI